MLVTVADVVSPSYFVATAAVELGFFREEGVDAEFIFPPADRPLALREGRLAFVGTSAYSAPLAFPQWRGGKLVCALSQHTYWFLAVRADLPAERGDVNAVKGLRISATGQPGLLLKQLLVDAGIDLERDDVRIVPPHPDHDPQGNLARLGVQAIEEGIADAYWGNAMRAEYGVRSGKAKVLLDVRRGDGPPAARHYTFPALMACDRLIEEQPDVVAGAVRAVVKTQKALRADPALATQVARKLSFPAPETELIATLIGRDAEFYQAQITEEAISGLNRFTVAAGLVKEPAPFEQIVAIQFRELWEA